MNLNTINILAMTMKILIKKSKLVQMKKVKHHKLKKIKKNPMKTDSRFR